MNHYDLINFERRGLCPTDYRECLTRKSVVKTKVQQQHSGARFQHQERHKIAGKGQRFDQLTVLNALPKSPRDLDSFTERLSFTVVCDGLVCSTSSEANWVRFFLPTPQMML